MGEAVVTKVGAKSTRGKGRKIVVGVDKTPEDVLKYFNDGNRLFFDDDPESFLELSTEVLQQLSLDVRKRYQMAKSIALGDDVIGSVTDSVNGFETDYNVRSGAASENTKVYGKKQGMEYQWARPDKVNYHKSRGWTEDHDKGVRTRFTESGSVKTVGGQNKPEMILVSRPTEVGNQDRAKRKQKRERFLKGNQDALRETFNQAGVRVLDE